MVFVYFYQKVCDYMFYDKQSRKQQEEYKNMLAIIGKLTLLFSESDSPYLPYRCHENIFCKYFDAENLGRKDCSADAKKEDYGIGLKTWVGNDDQKVAEYLSKSLACIKKPSSPTLAVKSFSSKTTFLVAFVKRFLSKVIIKRSLKSVTLP